MNVDNNDPDSGGNVPTPLFTSLIDFSKYNWLFNLYFILPIVGFIVPFVVILIISITTDTRFYFYLWSYPAVAIRFTIDSHLSKKGKLPYGALICNISFHLYIFIYLFNSILLYGCYISYNFEF